MSRTEPRKGEIWLVNFNPSKGSEIAKSRPAIVVSEDWVGKLPLRIVVPITDWKASYEEYAWFTCLKPDRSNGLRKISGADAFQVKSVSVDRFTQKLGWITEDELEMIVNAIALCVGV